MPFSLVTNRPFEPSLPFRLFESIFGNAFGLEMWLTTYNVMRMFESYEHDFLLISEYHWRLWPHKLLTSYTTHWPHILSTPIQDFPWEVSDRLTWHAWGWAWLIRLSAGIASSKLALQYYTKYVLFNVLLISQVEMLAELKKP